MLPPARVVRSLCLVLLGSFRGFAFGGPDVLFLNSYHPGLGWSDALLDGVRGSMGPHEDLAVEYLDSKRFESRALDSSYAAEFRFKYSGRQPRAILASDDYALDFLLQWRDTLFPGVPVVFCGINDFRPSMIAGRHGYTGVSQWNPMVETAALVPRLYPGTTDVWVVTESSATGTGNRLRLDSLARCQPGGLRFHFFDSAGTPTWNEIVEKVRHLPPGNVVYWSELFLDRQGRFIDPEVDLGALVASSPVPFFTHQASYLSSGILGGRCNRGLEHGRQAARLLRQVLSGRSPDSLPVEADSSIADIFRWDALQRFPPASGSLPAEAVILGRPVEVWHAYPRQTAAALATLALLAAMAAGLLIALRRVRRSRAQLHASEAALRRTQANLQMVFDTISDAVFVHAESGRIEFLNAGGQRMYGVTAEDLPRLDIAALSSESSLGAASLDALWEKIRQGERVMFEWRARRPFSGEEFDVEVSLAHLETDGDANVVAVVRDISERVEARRILTEDRDALERRVAERTRELTQANKELEAFSYSVSHDLRTPLRAINGFAHLLEEELDANLGDEQRDHLRRIRAAAIRMGETIDDLLRLSRIATLEVHRAPVDMEALVREIVADLPVEGAPPRWEIAALPKIQADEALLRLVWTNLLGNAAKYSSRSPTPRIRIGTQETEEGLVWYVSDNGVGFDPAFAHHLFHAFRRLHGPEEFPGAGIGLAIVHRAITRQGGRVWAEGRPGEGATFRFLVP